MWQTELGNYGSFFALLPSPALKNPKNQNFEKMKKIAVFIIILRMCTKNYDQMMYGSWDMVRDGWTDERTEKVTYRGGCPPKNGRCTKRNFRQIKNLRSEFICHFDASNVPAGNYMFKVNNGNTRTRCEICLKTTIKTPKRRHCFYC